MSESQARRPRSVKLLTLAGVGGDAHSIGLTVLSRSLARADTGFAVWPPRTALTRLWYLGGRPCLSADQAAVDGLRRLGFHRVFPDYVEPALVISVLDADLAAAGGPQPAGDATVISHQRRGPAARPAEQASLLDEREQVLSQWHTGADAASLDRNAGLLRERTWLSSVQERADARGRTLIHPRAGVSGVTASTRCGRSRRNSGISRSRYAIRPATPGCWPRSPTPAAWRHSKAARSPTTCPTTGTIVRASPWPADAMWMP